MPESRAPKPLAVRQRCESGTGVGWKERIAVTTESQAVAETAGGRGSGSGSGRTTGGHAAIVPAFG